jgi:hypothetical protein
LSSRGQARQPTTRSSVIYIHRNINTGNTKNFEGGLVIAFFTSAVDVLQTLVIALGAGLGIWGVINLLEGYGNDNPGAKSQGMKQLMAGGGVALIGMILVPLLSGLFG